MIASAKRNSRVSKSRVGKARFARLDRGNKPLDSQTFHWLAALVWLAQLPHYLHLPWWVSICGTAVVAIWVLACRDPQGRLYQTIKRTHVLAVVALLGALAVRLHYGYFLGRDPCVAMLFMLTACKFAETRKSGDASLLISLCGFLLLTQYFYSQTILAGIVTLPAVICLGGALFALSSRQHQPPAKQVVKKVAKLLLQGLPIALALFLLFPRLPGPLWNLPSDASAQTGLSDSMTPGAISELSQSGAVAFRVEFKDRIPAPHERYWRGPVLSAFDGRTWESPRQLYRHRPDQLQAQNKTDTITYTVTQQPSQHNWLFALEEATTLPTPEQLDDSPTGSSAQLNFAAQLTTDRQILSYKPLTRVVRYQMSSRLSDSYQPATPPMDGLTQISGKNLESVRFANQQRRASHSNADYAARILQWFNQEPFYYTLRPSLLGDAPIDEFLFSSRRGFCEHYASAFTFLMRAAGIPARVVTGYQGGEMNGDYMIVRQSDAHAWSEAWINGRWQRFDPTGAVAPSRVEQGIAAMPEDEPVPGLARRNSSWVKDWQLRWDSVNHSWHQMIVEFDSSKQNSLWSRTGLGKPEPVHLVIVTLLIAALWALAIVYQAKPARRKLPRAEKLWAQICRELEKRGSEIGKAEAPGHYQARLLEKWPAHHHAISSLFNQLEILRFGKLNADSKQELLVSCQRQWRDLKPLLKAS